MSSVLIVILGASALAFLGCFFLGICRDGRHVKNGDAVEVVRLSERVSGRPSRHRESA